jgi:hypothetical protein
MPIAAYQYGRQHISGQSPGDAPGVSLQPTYIRRIIGGDEQGA